MGNFAKQLTDSSFDTDVLGSDKAVLVDFWAEWCGPCRMIAPTVDALAQEYQGRLKVCKVNVDQESSIAGRYGIMSIPTLLLFKNGQIAEQMVGALPKQQ